jgi:hypothetical protein
VRVPCLGRSIRCIIDSKITYSINTYKIWGFDGGDFEECRLLGYKTPIRTSQETHYVSATESNQLMLCKIWGFHGGDYEECCRLGYKNPVRTSQETHYVSATEPSQLMPCKFCGFHVGDYEECHLLGYKTQFVLHRRHITSTLQSFSLDCFMSCNECPIQRTLSFSVLRPTFIGLYCLLQLQSRNGTEVGLPVINIAEPSFPDPQSHSSCIV